MRTQPLSPRISLKLQQYLDRLKILKYDEHGYTSFSKQNSISIIKKQLFERFEGSKEIWCATELGQPFLFWNNNEELDISGVLEYNYKDQMGTFTHETQEGQLIINKVHSYHVFVNINGKYLPANSRYLPELFETKDIYVSAIVKERKDTFTLNIYHNCELIFVMKDVFPEEYIFYGENTAYRNRLAYVRFAKKLDSSTYYNYIYDIRREKLFVMDASNNTPSWYIDFRKYSPPEWSRSRDKIINGNTINIIIHLDESKTSQIISEFIRKTADNYRRLNNIFDDDDTINIEISYKNKPEYVRFLYYCASINCDIFGNGLFEMSIDDFEKGTQNNRFEYKNILLIPEHEMSFYKNINRLLYQRCNEEKGINRLPLKIYDEYISGREMIVYMYQYLRDIAPAEYEAAWILTYMGKSNFSFEKEKEIYNSIFEKIAKEEKLSTRWKNEYSLYKLLIKEYKDAIYQYHSEWLGRQSLDIFVPSRKIAFEYQGRQHYHAVEYFGGEKQLQQQKERDNKKRQKCGENGIKLIEWRYDEPVSKLMLKKKLSEEGILNTSTN